MTSFVAPPRTFHPFLGIGVGVAISWGGLDVEIEPRGAEFRSILPRYVSKSGTACVSDVPIMWNPLHSISPKIRHRMSTRCHPRGEDIQSD